MHRHTQGRLRRTGEKEPQKQDQKTTEKVGISTHKIMQEEETGGSTAGNYRHNEAEGK